jgi:hypothetical protein
MRWSYLALVVAAAMLVAAPMALAAEKGGERGKAKGLGIHGEITAVAEDGSTITVAVKGKEKGESKTIAVTGDTKILVQKPATGPDGEKPKAEPGTKDDLKVGKKVVVKCTEDGKTALQIVVMSAVAHKRGGDHSK